MNKKDKNIVDNAKKWLSSPEGRESMKNSIQEAIERSKKFNESRQIDPKILKETFTI
ncbi:MAG: hypothetical protein JSV88_20615 [Candidatus Aminicenantes bacterium]|jgi:hypothetical protein|nr:MAG: hypothetical protein JSV88_20615 [Candidatus Aminicenantes bacterium]